MVKVDEGCYEKEVNAFENPQGESLIFPSLHVKMYRCVGSRCSNESAF